MTNQEILKKAIEKAVKNGYKFKELDKNWLVMATFALDKKYGWRDLAEIKEVIIFSHDFAKAFWGKEWKDGDVIETPMSDILTRENIEPWQHHLKQMVLLPEDERLKYIEKFL